MGVEDTPECNLDCAIEQAVGFLCWLSYSEGDLTCVLMRLGRRGSRSAEALTYPTSFCRRVRSMSSSPARLLIVDDDRMYRVGLRALFDPLPDMAVVAEATALSEAAALVTRLNPGVALVGLAPVEPLLAAGSGLAELGCPVLILAHHTVPAARVLAAGASGILLRQAPPQAIIGAARLVADGCVVMGRGPAQPFLDWVRTRAANDDPLAMLSLTERQILERVAEGLSNRQIAERLGLRENTVRKYASDIYRRLHVRNRTQAAQLLGRTSL